MADKPKIETPESLHRFFEALAPGDAEEARACELHYGCPCIVHRGRRAAQMLLEIQRVLGVEAVAPAPAIDPSTVVPVAEFAAVKSELDAEREKSRALDELSVKHARDADRLREHIRLLQRQLDRLHERREMSSVLGRIEGGKEAVAPPPAGETPSAETPPIVEPASSDGNGPQGEVQAPDQT